MPPRLRDAPLKTPAADNPTWVPLLTQLEIATGFRFVSDESVLTKRSMSASGRVALAVESANTPMRGMESVSGRNVMNAALVTSDAPLTGLVMT